MPAPPTAPLEAAASRCLAKHAEAKEVNLPPKPRWSDIPATFMPNPKPNTHGDQGGSPAEGQAPVALGLAKGPSTPSLPGSNDEGNRGYHSP